MRTSRTGTSVVIAVSALLGLGIGTGAVAYASQDGPPSSVSSPEADEAIGQLTSTWSKNADGLTVGLPTEADRRAQNLPDLTPAKTDTGKVGYFHARDYFWADARTPAEGVAMTKARLNDKNQVVLRVYAEDGETVVGTRVVAEVTMETLPE